MANIIGPRGIFFFLQLVPFFPSFSRLMIVRGIYLIRLASGRDSGSPSQPPWLSSGGGGVIIMDIIIKTSLQEIATRVHISAHLID
jgi:hypothetical protein